MTRIGKFFVFLNLAFSLVLLGWAFGLYTQRINWAFETDGEGKRVPGTGVITQLQDRIASLQQVRDPALARWQSARSQIARLEQQRAANQEWYAEQLKIL